MNIFVKVFNAKFLGLIYSLLLLTTQALGICQKLKVNQVTMTNMNKNQIVYTNHFFKCS